MVEDSITKALRKATGVEKPEVFVPEYADQGDFSSNIAMAMFSKDKDSNFNNPKELAESIEERLSKDSELSQYVSKIEVAGPGFINFFIDQKYLVDTMDNFSRGNFGIPQVGKGKTVVIDYSSPNIAKRFSIGHLRSTIIGQALYNLYEQLGWKVIGDNHLGDWGTQFGVLIFMVRNNGLNPKELSIDDWERLYVDFHKQLDQKPELKDEARKAFKALESGDPEAKKIWKAAYETSLAEYENIYNRLGVKIDHAYGESFYEDKMSTAIEKALKRKIAIKSGKALVVEFGKYKLPSNLLVKSNGTSTYLARDLALMFFRKDEWNPDLQIFEVGADQNLYFRQVFALAEMMGLFTLDQLVHVGHGFVRLPEGSMSTRKGRTVKLEEVMNRAVAKAKKLGAMKGNLAEEIGLGAIKWNDLKRDPKTEIIFDWDEILSMEGNSGPYLQYTYARAMSVIGKAVGSKQLAVGKDSKLSSEEEALLRTFAQYTGTIIRSTQSYSPNILCNYLYTLAQRFNTFYSSDKIIGSQNEYFRLLLTRATAENLKHGLGLLGIQTPEKM